MPVDPETIFRSSQLVPLLYGYWARLEDLQNIQQAGKRISGGISYRIQDVNLTRQVLEDRILSLATSDPEAAQELYGELCVSQISEITQFAQQLKLRLKDQTE
jgi:hypothetical protein